MSCYPVPKQPVLGIAHSTAHRSADVFRLQRTLADLRGPIWPTRSSLCTSRRRTARTPLTHSGDIDSYGTLPPEASGRARPRAS